MFGALIAETAVGARDNVGLACAVGGREGDGKVGVLVPEGLTDAESH